MGLFVAVAIPWLLVRLGLLVREVKAEPEELAGSAA